MTLLTIQTLARWSFEITIKSIIFLMATALLVLMTCWAVLTFKAVDTAQILFADELTTAGIQTIESSAVNINFNHLFIDTIKLSGEWRSYRYTLVMRQLDIDYNFMSLVQGQARNLTVNSVHLTTFNTPQQSSAVLKPTPSLNDAYKLFDYLPQQYLKKLPLKSGQIGQFQWFNQSGAPHVQLNPVSANLTLQNEQLTLAVNAVFFEREHQITLHSKPDHSLSIRAIQTTQGTEPIKFNAQLQSATGLPAKADQANHWHWLVDAEIDYGELYDWLPIRRHIQQLQPELTLSAMAGATIINTNISHPSLFTKNNNWLDDVRITGLATHQLIDLSAHYRPMNIAISNMKYDLKHKFDLTLLRGGGELVRPAQLSLDFTLLDQPRDTTTQSGSVKLELATATTIKLSPQHWYLTNSQSLLHLDAPNQTSQIELTLNDISIEQSQSLRLNAAATLSGKINDIVLPNNAHQLNLNWHTDHLSAELNSNLPAGDIQLQHQIRWQPPTQDFQWQGQLVIKQLDQAFALLPSLLPTNIRVDDGQFSATINSTGTSLDWRQWSKEIDLSLENLSGNYAGTPIKELSVYAQLTGSQRLRSSSPLTISLEETNPATPIKQFRATGEVVFNLPDTATLRTIQPEFSINQLNLKLLGGSLYSAEPFTYVPHKNHNKFKLKIDNWDSKQLIQLLEYKGLAMTGRVDGLLPIIINENSIVISDGTLIARDPGGLINYSSDLTDQDFGGGNQLNLAVQLLKDFHYDEFQSSVNLSPDLLLTLGIELKGNNPLVYSGRATNFNIALENELAPLLEYLRLNNKILDGIEDQFEQ